MTARSGLDESAFDPTIRAQDDLFGHANGGWITATTFPQDRGRYTVFDVLNERAEARVLEIITEVSTSGPAAGTVAAKVGDLYRSFMDEDDIEARGIAPIEGYLVQIDQLSSIDQIAGLLGQFARAGIGGVVIPFVNTDDRDSSRYVVYLEQSGIGLPDEAYYREDEHADVLAAYAPHVARMLTLTGRYAATDAVAAAAQVVELEQEIAKSHADQVSNRDPVKTYTLLSREELATLMPGFDWAAYLSGLGAPEFALDRVVVRQPDHCAAVAELLRGATLPVWQHWLRWQVIHAFAPYLSAPVVAENFDFTGRTLSGVPELRDRWKRGVALVQEVLGEAVGQLYVERYFPPENKARMLELVKNVIEAFRRSFHSLAWMGAQTRREALAKLDSFTPKIGYPDRWRDYSSLQIDAGDLVGNVARANAFETDRQLAKLGRPVDRGEWFMNPQMVNAYYNAGLNEIVFPAGILQPPFFDVEADDAVNYGAIGAVIGHEIGHGFDDRGAQFDGAGNLRQWWGESDKTAFDSLAGRLVSQFEVKESRFAPGRRVNGALTVGENIGDIGGLAIGLSAYRIACADNPPPVIEGRSGEQRFFIGWARLWGLLIREQEAVKLLATDPHSPNDLRANVVSNRDEFHEVFATTEADGMWLPEADRVRIF